MIHEGSCHCGAIRFSFRGPEITKGVRCNCSICRRKGAVMSEDYVPPDRFETLTGLEQLTRYRWGDTMVNHWFCSVCGIYPFHDAIETPGHYRINLGCVDGVDPLAVQVRFIDGASF
ncbi:MAG: GFA family protein [Myxococcota bacterium]